jgi:Glycosyltransferase 61
VGNATFERVGALGYRLVDGWPEVTLNPDVDLLAAKSISPPQHPGEPVAFAPRELRLCPADPLDYSRRSPREGFTSRERPETIVLVSATEVQLPDPPDCEVQTGVTDPAAERGMRMNLSSRYRYPVQPLLACRLPHAIVDTSAFLIMPNERRYLTDSVRHLALLSRWGYEFLANATVRREVEEIPERDERVVVLGAQTNRNYSHWLVESVARALLYRPLDDGTRLYLTPPLYKWQREILNLIGVADERILELEPQGPVRFREVVAVSRGMGAMPALRPAAVHALAALAPASAGRRRIYCSRAVALRRHVVNEVDMVNMLIGHGFEAICPETLPFRAQIETFAEAEAVLALHGSALTNIAFSRPGTRVIELQPEGFSQNGTAWNWILARLREQPITQVVCPLADTLRDRRHEHRDVTVDVRHLDDLLGRLLAP